MGSDSSKMNPIDSDLLEVCSSICRILYSNKKESGFFIRLDTEDDEPLFALMTNGHIITEKMIEDKKEIEVFYNNQKKSIKIILNKDERFIQCFKDMKIDCTVVEILPEDNINKDYFLVPNLDYNEENYKSLIDKEICIVQFSKEKLSHSEGKITKITEYELNHRACTDEDSPGSPIFLIKSTKVIGIHKADKEKKKENDGNFIFPIVNKLKKIKRKKSNNNNGDNINNNDNNNEKTKDKKINEVKIIIRPNLINFYLFGDDFISLNSDKLELIVNGNSGLDLKKFYKKEKKYFLNIGEKNEIILKEITTVTNMSNMFSHKYCDIIAINFKNWDISNVTNMEKMFLECNNIKGISNWNTSKVNNMSYMFSKCNNIPNISNWDTSNVKDMSYMFNECNIIPDISNWDTSNVKLMTGLFFNCIYLSSLPDLSKWDTYNVEDFSKMFDECKSLQSLPDISKWETSSVKDMSYMFHNCWSLAYFPDISKWKIFNVQNMSHMFHNCWSVTSFQKLNWNISNVTDMSFMFHNFPLQPFAFIHNFNFDQNVDHMFTDFSNYCENNSIINIKFKTTTGLSIIVQAYKDMIIGDVIDLFLKKSKFLYYSASYQNNTHTIDDKINQTIGELSRGNETMDITCYEQKVIVV